MIREKVSWHIDVNILVQPSDKRAMSILKFTHARLLGKHHSRTQNGLSPFPPVSMIHSDDGIGLPKILGHPFTLLDHPEKRLQNPILVREPGVKTKLIGIGWCLVAGVRCG